MLIEVSGGRKLKQLRLPWIEKGSMAEKVPLERRIGEGKFSGKA